MHAVRLRALTKDFATGFWRSATLRALDAVTLDIEQGEALGYLGPNGAGKTTTLKLLMQALFPTAGSAEVLGRPAGDRAVRRRTGFLPEALRWPAAFSAEELLVHHARLFGFAPAEARRRTARILDRVGIGARRRSRLRGFSRGMLQRVGIAQALVNDPDVILLDEPLSGLDPLGRRDMRNLLLGLREEGRTLLLCSHLLADAERICSRVAILDGGRLVATTRIADLQAAVSGWVIELEGIAREALPPAVTARKAAGRLRIELPAEERPDALVADLLRRGGRLISLAPRRRSLEDYYAAHVAGSAGSAREAWPNAAGLSPQAARDPR